jgi:hypothetical protein
MNGVEFHLVVRLEIWKGVFKFSWQTLQHLQPSKTGVFAFIGSL